MFKSISKHVEITQWIKNAWLFIRQKLRSDFSTLGLWSTLIFTGIKSCKNWSCSWLDRNDRWNNKMDQSNFLKYDWISVPKWIKMTISHRHYDLLSQPTKVDQKPFPRTTCHWRNKFDLLWTVYWFLNTSFYANILDFFHLSGTSFVKNIS